MRTVIIIFIAVLCISVPDSQAHRYLPGQRGIQFTAGTINGLCPDAGFHSEFAFSEYTKSANRWMFGIEYMEKRHSYKNLKIPQSQFTVDAGYYLKFLSDWRKTFFMSAGASAMAGYETINWNEKLLPDGATINNGDAFLYGGAISLELEIFLTDRLVLITNVWERLLMGSSVGKLNTRIGIGIKIIIN